MPIPHLTDPKKPHNPENRLSERFEFFMGTFTPFLNRDGSQTPFRPSGGILMQGWGRCLQISCYEGAITPNHARKPEAFLWLFCDQITGLPDTAGF